MKNIKCNEIVVPISIAALVTQVNLLHHAKLRFLMRYLNMNPTRNHGKTLIPVAGGVKPTKAKEIQNKVRYYQSGTSG